MLSLFASSAAFQGPAMKAGGRSTAVQMRAEGEIGVTPPLGVYDPLNILATPVVPRRRSDCHRLKVCFSSPTAVRGCFHSRNVSVTFPD